MKTKFLFVAVAAAGLAFSACDNSEKMGERGFEFSPYSYEAVVKDTTTNGDDDAPLRLVEGYGVLPDYIAGQDITALRDTLMSMGLVQENQGQFSLAPPATVTPVNKKPDPNDPDMSHSSIWLSVKNMTPEVIVWQSYYSSYTMGDAHPISSTEYLTYDVKGKRILTLGNIFKKGYETTLKALIINELTQQGLVERIDPDIPLPKQFYITSAGMTFVYGVYEIASYADGEISVPVDAVDLDPILRDDVKRLFGL